MKRFVLAALAAATVVSGGAAASAAPLHPIFGGHGPILHGGPGGFHPGPIHPGPVGFHPGPGGLHPGPGGFHPMPIGFHPGGSIWWRGPHPGWGYHNWGYGAFIPAAWLAPEYFVADFVDYGLAPPPPNFEWVQDGPNALLVNLDTAQVVEVVPNAFA